ncbi:hypothetical protein POM88_014245 [Heracleum sosnowskyi]|uniref:Ty3 transposon capsid-like protein domain-containing protein n=1 Tax=Heracleum sosnowskyi TaxID=360622 RepID=A0AAD8J1L3_9APIA|nr:hypothetical protein POM88_014245 [Heracleum sosnowskyi]
MASNTRSRTTEEQWRDIEARIQEVSASCHKKIAETSAQMEKRIIDKMDQVMTLVSGCDAKIEAYNASMEERIKVKVDGAMKIQNMEKVIGRDGEIWVNRSPILQTPVTGSRVGLVEDNIGGKERMMKTNFHPPRIEIPCFGGEDPRTWLRKCDKFFALHKVSEIYKVEIVEMYLESKADVWYQGFKLLHDKFSWSQFGEALMKRFGKNGGLDVQEEFNKLSQTGSLMDYVERFEELKSLVLYRNANLEEGYFISSFISGLKMELKPMVRLMKPQSLLDAIEIAQYQEQTIEVIIKKQEIKKWSHSDDNKSVSGNKKLGSNQLEEKKKTGVSEYFKKISPEEFQYRKNNHLCYKCGEKYGQGHICKNQQYTYMLIDEVKDKEIAELLEEEESEEGTVTEVSLNALSDSMMRKTITLEGTVKGEVIQILVDTGSTLTILDSAIVEKLKLTGEIRNKLDIKLANGSTVSSSLVIPKLTWEVQNYKFCCDARVLNIGNWDMIVGVDWLEQYSPIMFDFKKLHLRLNATGTAEEQVLLQGAVKEKATIKLVRGKKLSNLNQEIVRKQFKSELQEVVLATSEMESNTATQAMPDNIAAVIKRYSKVFAIPTSLPPTRSVDHAIPLQNSAKPFKLKPYRYPHSQKSEIEKQVQDMLNSGTIKTSNSPYASPVIWLKRRITLGDFV